MTTKRFNALRSDAPRSDTPSHRHPVSSPALDAPTRFTSQHFTIAVAIANGKTTKQIAGDLGLSLKRTENALRHACLLLDLPQDKNRDAMLTRWAARNNLLFATIDQRLQALAARKEKLLKLIALQNETDRLELQAAIGPAADLHNTITRQVAIQFGVTLQAILSRTRGIQPVADARMVACYLAETLTAKDRHEIGRAFHRSPCAISYAVRQVKNRLTINKPFAAQVTALQAACAGTPGSGTPL